MRKSLLRGLLCSPLLLALCAAAGLAQGQTHYVYTNDNVFNQQGSSKQKDPSNLISTSNTVTGFAVNADGSLTELANSPFNTGGDGAFLALVGASKISTLIVGNFLYVTNDGSGNVTGFQIDPATGNLTPIAGSPFAVTGESAQLALTPTPDGQFLMVADELAGAIYAFAIDANGSLTVVPGSPFAASETTIQDVHVTQDGQYLAASLQSLGAVEVFAIGGDGSLTAVPGSPFPVSNDFEVPLALDAPCSADRLYAGLATFTGNETHIEGFGVAPDGSLTPLPTSPYPAHDTAVTDVQFGVGDKYLFASSFTAGNATSLSSYAVASDGSLSEVAGSPVDSSGGNATIPLALAVDANGQFLFVANFGGSAANNSVGSFVIAADGSLTPAPGSPYLTGENGLLSSIAAYPPKDCAFQSEVTIECAGNTTVAPAFLVGCEPSAQLTYATPTASTTCPGGNVTVTCEPASGSVFPMGTTVVTCTATDDCGSIAECSFAVVVADPFAAPGGAVCVVDDLSGDTFREVVAPGPLRGFWIYHVAATGEDICGIANKVTYQANRSLVSSDTNYSSENPFYYMDANVNFGTRSATVTVSRKGTSRKYTLRDRNITNDPPCTGPVRPH